MKVGDLVKYTDKYAEEYGFEDITGLIVKERNSRNPTGNAVDVLWSDNSVPEFDYCEDLQVISEV